MAATLTSCGDDESDCAGKQTGDITLKQGQDQHIKPDGNIGMAQADVDTDPPWLSLGIWPASEEDKAAARKLHLDESFTVAGATYTVVGICDDRAYLNQGRGPS